MSARIAPAHRPFPEKVQATLDKTMGDHEPLVLFTTLARDERLFHRFFSGGLLDKGALTLRNREIIIDRITARSHSEYEWGVHVSLFGAKAGLTEEEIVSTVRGSCADACWNDEEKALIAACDQLHDTCDLDNKAWADLKTHFGDEAIIEILMLAGQYRTVSYLTNALRMPLESYARPFPT